MEDKKTLEQLTKELIMAFEVAEEAKKEYTEKQRIANRAQDYLFAQKNKVLEIQKAIIKEIEDRRARLC